MRNGRENRDPVGFGSFVADYERVVDPLTLPIGCHALDRAGLVPGDAMIDVAAGTGALALEAAKRGVRVLATDVAPEMVARAAERLAPYPACEARAMRFDALDIADAGFDAALSIVGVLAFSGGEDGLRELVRVTRPGGRIVVATWDQERQAAPQYLAREVFTTLFPERRLWPDDLFPPWSRTSLAAAMRAAGCEAAEVGAFEGVWTVGRPAEVMDEARLSISRLPGYGALGEDERGRFDRAFTEAVVRHAGADGVARIPTRAIVGTGRVPDRA